MSFSVRARWTASVAIGSSGATAPRTMPGLAGDVDDAEGDQSNAQATVIDGWTIQRQISSTVGMRDRFLVERVDDGRRAVLTLYHQGSEPDPSIYDALRRVALHHVPEILAMGRWEERAFEVAEELAGGSLADLGIVATEASGVRQIVSELGMALNALAEVGLRHRDLRPGTLLVRHRDPLDLVIGGFGSARLSEFDLDIVSPLEITPYTAPEAVAGGVAAASDWWSLGIILLEQLTQGRCFEGVSQQAFLIHVLANGVPIPQELDADIAMLLRGLLTRDRLKRWRWPQVQAWLAGQPIDIPPVAQEAGPATNGPAIALGGRRYHSLMGYAVAAAEAPVWEEARDQLVRGALVSWAQESGAQASTLAALRRIARQDALDEDFRLLAALKVLNPDMPAIHRGQIVTPRWLLVHPIEAYELITGDLPDLLVELGAEGWLAQLKARSVAVRARARALSIELDEDTVRIHVLVTSRVKLATEWEERRRLLPDTQHSGLLHLMESRTLGEEDLIVLLSAAISHFRSRDAIVDEARILALSHGVHQFTDALAQDIVRWPRNEIMQAVAERVEGFARCAVAGVNDWADEFRLEKRIPIARALVLLAIPQAQWQALQKQEYISRILDFFEKKIVATVMRGPLVRMTIGKTTTRVDLTELGSARVDPAALLDHLLQRSDQVMALDPSSFDVPESSTEPRMQSLERHTQLHKRDTGIDGLYLGFPFLLARDARANSAARIAPVLLWPVKLHSEIGTRGNFKLSFDGEREEVRLNPALEGLLGPEAAARWRKSANELLGRSSLRAVDVIDALGTLATPRNRTLVSLPGPKVQVRARSVELECAAVMFHVTFSGQAIGEDIRQLKALPAVGTGLETALRLGTDDAKPAAGLTGADLYGAKHGTTKSSTPWEVSEVERFFTVSSDPSQEDAVMRARAAPGLVVEGPPGTGKSQTIVNMVADAIGRGQSMLIVCQKHAALEVVHKRLVAQGLGHRVAMINDVNKDRAPVIKAVREQIEQLVRRKDDPAVQVRRKRQELGARIEALEGALDAHHEALHRVDERAGMSYRELLGELILLETPAPPLDVPALRSDLERLDTGALAALEEEVAPLVRHWLPARFEGSALSQLQPFSPDRATLEDFGAAWQRFTAAENVRSEVLVARHARFDLEDPAQARQWLAAYGRVFLELPDAHRSLLARWLPLFRGEVGGRSQDAGTHDAMVQDDVAQAKGCLSEKFQPSGFVLMDALRSLRVASTALPVQDFDEELSPVLCKIAPSQLMRLRMLSKEAATPGGLLALLNPMRHARRRRLSAFMKGQGQAATPQRLHALLAAVDLEFQVRPLRASLQEIHAQLQLGVVQDDAVAQLLPTASSTLQSMQQIAICASQLASSPDAVRFDSVARSGSRDEFLRLYADYDDAFARYDVRAASRLALSGLQAWMQPEWFDTSSRAVADNVPLLESTRSIDAALPALAHYQYFRDRARRLDPAAASLLVKLRAKEAQLDGIASDQLEGEVRRLINREARLGWRRSMEQHSPQLLQARAEFEAKVANLAALDADARTQWAAATGELRPGCDPPVEGVGRHHAPDRPARAATSRVHRHRLQSGPHDAAPRVANEPGRRQPRAAAEGGSLRRDHLRRGVSDACRIRVAVALSSAHHGRQGRRETDAADGVFCEQGRE